MSVLTVTNLNYSIGERQILKDVSFSLNQGEHIGLIGPNGEGKSTFLSIIMKTLLPDDGKIQWAKRSKIGYLDQKTKLEKGMTIREVLKSAFDDSYNLEKELLADYEKMADATESEMNYLMNETSEIQTYLETSGFYSLDSKIEEVAAGLGVSSYGLDSDVTSLSGGQRNKVLLTKLLLEDPNILILDEPTNFLDENQVMWLKNYLLNFENAFILISHDIQFLKDVINVVYHLEDSMMVRYSGGYDFYLKNSEIRKRQQNDKYEEQQREIAHLEDTIARNKARVATRGLASSLQKRLDKMELLEKTSEKIKPTFRFPMSDVNLGKIAFELKDVVLGYDFPLTKKINLSIMRGEKIAIVGVNGLGKTTLIKTLLGLIKPFEGAIKNSDNMKIGYFEQECQNQNKTAFDEIFDEYPKLSKGGILSALASCGINKNTSENLMVALSGGENAKVRLCKLTLKECNILVLDEPTNHLDNLAKEALKEALISYKGTVLFVSHERDFIDEVKTMEIRMEDFAL